MKKRNLTFAILLLAVVLTAVGVSGTYARYVTTDSGTGTATVAKWDVDFQDANGTALSSTWQLALNQTVTNQQGVVNGKIAPDSEVYGEIIVDLTGTEVATDIFADLGTITGLPDGSASAADFSVKVYNVTTEEVQEVSKDTTTGKYIFTDALKSDGTALENDKVKIRVALVWTNKDAHNETDTAIGEGVTNITATLTLTAQQHIYGNVNASDK